MDRRRQKVPGAPSAQFAATGSSSGQSQQKISGTTPAPSAQFAVAGSSSGQPQTARWICGDAHLVGGNVPVDGETPTVTS